MMGTDLSTPPRIDRRSADTNNARQRAAAGAPRGFARAGHESCARSAAKHPLSLSALLLLLLVVLALTPAATATEATEFSATTRPGRLQRALTLQRAEATLEQMIQRVDFPLSYLQPVPLSGVRIPGLTAKGVELLGFNYFVVVSNTHYADMAEVYRENRLRGKSNFVTADSIIHPYFAFTNQVLAGLIKERLIPDLSSLLKAMLKTALDDYKQADDEEVRDDIERNIAFLSVAIELLDPAFFPPRVGSVDKLIKADLDAVLSGRKGRSAIFEQEEDFGAYQPAGLYRSKAELSNFYRCREWISRMAYPITDVTFNTGGGGTGNNFRRSVLLFRCLDTATVDGQPAYEIFSRLKRTWPLMGPPIAMFEERTISPEEYKSVFKSASGSLKVTLSSLSEPLFRTRLMLSIRKQKPVQLGATSIFELEEGRQGSGLAASFRLFPVTGDPEMPWMRSVAKFWKEEGLAAPSWPLALLDLHAWGAGQASNLLASNIFRLDPKLTTTLPLLERSVKRRLPGGQSSPVKDRRWQLLSTYFQPAPEGAQSVLRTETWLNRRLESAFAGWVDSHLALAAADDTTSSARAAQAPGSASGQDPPAAANGDERAAQASAARPKARQAFYHYLEPCPDLFRRIRQDAEELINECSLLQYMPPALKERFDDFIRFASRLERIAEAELMGRPLTAADLNLLGNIDVFLEKVVVPVAGTLTVTAAGEDGKDRPGLSFGLGRPGLLYIILQSGQRTTLARGAVYTYYEVPGGPIKPEHWHRKLDFGLVHQPFWTDKFDLTQQQQPAKSERPR